VRTFRFGDTWTVAAPPQAVRDVLVDLERYPAWWPQVRAVAPLGPDDARVVCRSALPYDLELGLHAVSRDVPRLEVALSGDLDGMVCWQLTPGPGSTTRMDFAQQVRVRGRLLGLGAYLARPLLAWNHDQMMAGCLAGLRRELR